MKLFIGLPFLTGVVLAAPQQLQVARDTKPFKEVPTNTANCYERDDTPNNKALHPLYSEECTGTMAYCFSQYYELPRNSEDFASTDECLLSRGVNPKTINVHRILSRQDYAAGLEALQDGNGLYNRYALITQLYNSHVPREHDEEGSDLIDKLWRSNKDRASRARKFLETAKEKFATAFSAEFSREINQAIQEARGKLTAAWGDVTNADVTQVANLQQWITGKTEDKYKVNL